MRGITLPEVAISVVIVGILAVSGFSAFTFAQKQIYTVAQQKNARDIAFSHIDLLKTEDMLSLPFTFDQLLEGINYHTEIAGVYTGDTADKKFWLVTINVSFPLGNYSVDTIIGDE